MCKKVRHLPNFIAMCDYRLKYVNVQALIIAKEISKYTNILESTKAIFFFGTPHRGSALANFVSIFASPPKVVDFLSEFISGKGKLIRRNLIDDLNPNSRLLNELFDSFVERAANVDCIRSFIEEKKLPHLPQLVSLYAGFKFLDGKRSRPRGTAHCTVIFSLRDTIRFFLSWKDT